MPPLYAYNYIVYKDSSGYHAISSDGSALPIQGPPDAPENAINAALNQPQPENAPELGPGHIYIQSGRYNLSKNFQGFDLNPYTRLTLDPTAILIVPSDYTGYVFRLRSTDSTSPGNPTGETSECMIDGGTIQQQKDQNGSFERQWTAIRLQASANASISRGVFFNRVVNTTIRDANIGIEFLVDGEKGWINSNQFQYLKLWSCNIFIDFKMTVNYPGIGVATPGIGQNSFLSLQCQSGSNTRVGVNNVRNVGNTFIDVQVWDIGTGDIPRQGVKAKSAVINSDASNTIIIGGSMAIQDPGMPQVNPRFIDNGKYTKIIDQWQGLKFANDTNNATSTIELAATEAERIGFFGMTPVPRQPKSTSGDTAGGSYTNLEREMLQRVYDALKQYGLIG